MIAIKILLGLAGLGIVVFVHELGHFVAARIAGVDVVAFSIGWGKPILKKKIGQVEYRIGMFPIGGYCKMKGENDYEEAWRNMQNGVKAEKGSYLSANPANRILVSIGGPFFNLVFAIVLLSLIWGFGFDVNTLGNKIILASEINGELYPADSAGLQTGDRIVEINGRKTSYYNDVQESIALNPGKVLSVTVDRNGEIINIDIKPSLDKSTGAGKIGVYFWNDPVIESVTPGSAADIAGLRPNDLLIAANGTRLRNTMDFSQVLEQRPPSLTVEYLRGGESGTVTFNDTELYEEGLGFSWASIHYRTEDLSFPRAVARGFSEGFKTLAISVKSIGLLFRGIDLTQAVSGPVRITYMMGDAAAYGFGQGIGTGLRSMADFLALISIALCVMNLLPLPILDGGMILLFLVEIIRKKPAHPKAVGVFQAVGAVFIFGLMAFALFGDILYIVRR
jgi:regulator of sigma E protease